MHMLVGCIKEKHCCYVNIQNEIILVGIFMSGMKLDHRLKLLEIMTLLFSHFLSKGVFEYLDFFCLHFTINKHLYILTCLCSMH